MDDEYAHRSRLYCVAKIHGSLEAKIHFRCQPADFSADLSKQARNQQSMTDLAMKVLCLRKALIEMHGVIVPTDIPKHNRVLFNKCA